MRYSQHMEQYPPGVSESDRVVLFDGQCVMCSASARFLANIDRRHEFILGTVQSREGRAILLWHDLPTETCSSFVLCEGPKYYLKSSACIRIAKRLRFPWNLGAVIWIIPRPVRDWLYDFVARNRYRFFGRTEQCVVLKSDGGVRLLSPSQQERRRDT